MTQDEKEIEEKITDLLKFMQMINKRLDYLSTDRNALLKVLQKAFCKLHGCLTNMSWYELMDEMDNILDEVQTQAELKEWEVKMMSGEFK
jgi:hypothetical protein